MRRNGSGRNSNLKTEQISPVDGKQAVVKPPMQKVGYVLQ